MSLVVGIDLGGTHVQIGVVEDSGRILADQRMHTEAEDGPEAVLDRIAKAVSGACEVAGVSLGEIDAVGLAAPGAIDVERGVVLVAPNLGWSQFPLRDQLSRRLDRPVVVDNDVSSAVWGEYWLGAARGTRYAMGLWVGTGVGAGLVINGQLYHGPTQSAVEIGWTILRPDAPPGARTVEELCSRTGMSRIIHGRLDDFPGSPLQACRRREDGVVPSDMLAAAVAADDPLAVEVTDTAACLLGTTIANMVTMLELETVVLGGGISEVLGERWLQRIRGQFEKDVFPEESRVCRLRMTELRNNAGLLGAAMLAARNVIA